MKRLSTRARRIAYRAGLHDDKSIREAINNGLRWARGCGIKSLTELALAAGIKPEKNIKNKYDKTPRKKPMKTYENVSELQLLKPGQWERSEKDDRKEFLSRKPLYAFRRRFGSLPGADICFVRMIQQAIAPEPRYEQTIEENAMPNASILPILNLDDSPSLPATAPEAEFTAGGGSFGGGGASASWDSGSSDSGVSPSSDSSSYSDSSPSSSDSSSSSSSSCDCGSSTDSSS